MVVVVKRREGDEWKEGKRRMKVEGAHLPSPVRSPAIPQSFVATRRPTVTLPSPGGGEEGTRGGMEGEGEREGG